MKKRDYYILFLLILLVTYATYYRSQVRTNKIELSNGKKVLNTIQQSGIITITPASNYNDSISSIQKRKIDKPST
ncbi:hypothetical protein ACUNWD_13485 [Sunxiuqinia sp. A32]|uniref:hypothetical protein n=1 Tax=Sunxiuqinia sp. A32 TaxID=3461496 RepID=UPI0040452D72